MSFLKKKAKALRLLPSFYAHIRIQRHNAGQIGQSGAWGSGRQWGSAFPYSIVQGRIWRKVADATCARRGE